LRAFDIVVPAAGSTHSAVRISPERMAELVGAEWVDVCEQREAGQVEAGKVEAGQVEARQVSAGQAAIT
jgi:hypothetical protein